VSTFGEPQKNLQFPRRTGAGFSLLSSQELLHRLENREPIAPARLCAGQIPYDRTRRET